MAIDRGQGIAVTKELAQSYDVGNLVEEAEASRDAAAVSAGEALYSKATAVASSTLAEESETVATQAAGAATQAAGSAAVFMTDTEGFRDEAEGFKDEAETAASTFVDWTTDQGATDIHSGNYTNTVYDSTVIDEAVALNTAKVGISSTQATKLAGIEASADVTDTANVVSALTPGTNISIATDGTIAATDTNTGDVNVQSDWSQATNTADDYIKGKPTIPTALANITDFTTGTGVVVNTALTIDNVKVPKVFIQTNNPATGTFEAGDLWWDTDGYTCRIAVTIGSSLAWFGT